MELSLLFVVDFCMKLFSAVIEFMKYVLYIQNVRDKKMRCCYGPSMHVDFFWSYIHPKNEVKHVAGGPIAAKVPCLISHVQDAL